MENPKEKFFSAVTCQKKKANYSTENFLLKLKDSNGEKKSKYLHLLHEMIHTFGGFGIVRFFL